ncbi:MAG: hypothetical protein ABEH56_05450 [Salinirussus sp.]
MSPETTQERRRTTREEAPTETRQFVSEESIVIRNYDGQQAHRVTVTMLDMDGQQSFEQTYDLDPREVVSVSTRLDRTVYRIEVETGTGRTASVDCLVGSGPDETALVELGNGLVSVSEGVA